MHMQSESDDALESIQQSVQQELAALRCLQEGIEEADSDAEVPYTADTSASFEVNNKSNNSHTCASLSLGSARRNDKRLQRTQRPPGKPRPCFDLADLNARLCTFIVTQDENDLELPAFSAPQRRQVKALAALYGLEPRSCGRSGQTLFKTPASAPLTAEAQLKADSMLRCSIRSGKPARQEPQAAQKQARAALAVPIAADNRGSVMLRQMGWQEGTGLGASREGCLTPIQLSLQRGRSGLGTLTSQS